MDSVDRAKTLLPCLAKLCTGKMTKALLRGTVTGLSEVLKCLNSMCWGEVSPPTLKAEVLACQSRA